LSPVTNLNDTKGSQQIINILKLSIIGQFLSTNKGKETIRKILKNDSKLKS
jgi:hypothetical protein